MAADLYNHHRGFAAALDELCAALDPHLEVALSEVLRAAPETATGQLIHHTSYAQPALFAVGVGLYRVLEQAGIHPDYLLGHSIGELTAAYLGGVWSLADAAVLVCARGRLMGACLPGAMLAVRASQSELAGLLDQHPGVQIAALNAASSTVVSGPAELISAFDQHCHTRHYQTRTLQVSHAFHSAAMDPALEEFHTIAAGLTAHPPRIAVLSNLTGELATTDQLTSAQYWTQHLRQPVRFYDNVTSLLAQGPHLFVELAAHPVLATALSDTLADHPHQQHSAVIP
ncbi:acyltransferase domain-containing protein, partial [Mycobacterium szulgai]|uniref:acyltransferase domain-containing protein n=1 Tax=Mycobacterium szulgai TaxID=1787 RepID=UPI0021F2B961